MEHTYCVIMAGGKGERFWPLSTRTIPKPFLSLIGDKTMIQMTMDRVRYLAPEERTFVVLGEDQLEIAKKQLNQLPDEHFIVEPAGRDTAPCIGFTAMAMRAIDPEALMVVMPADHYIPDEDAFVKTIFQAVECARSGDYLVTVGIKPTRPETGYGYIHAVEEVKFGQSLTCSKVNRFVEKPSAPTAVDYLADGRYYWNSGVFVWKAQVVLQGIEQHMPALYEGLMKIDEAILANEDEKIDQIFKGFESLSIDYGLMEKADNVLMVKANFGWDDVGTWSSLLRVVEVDRNGNYIKGEPICIDTQDCVVCGDNIAIGTIGVSNLIIVASKDGVLVCDINRDQEARKIAKLLEAGT
jgi:mannose-1-phosphate guanylyltransferase